MNERNTNTETDRSRREPTQLLLEQRRQAEAAAERRPLAEDVSLVMRSIGPLTVGVFDPGEVRTSSVVLYLHGGGFRQGTVRTYAWFTSSLAASLGARLVSVDYRLAPEHPFPAGLDDAIAAYRWLDGQLDPRSGIFVAGDSAGGGLAASLLLACSQCEVRKPLAAAFISPWVDLRNVAESLTASAGRDVVFPLSSATEAADMYLAGWDPLDVRVSPVLGDWSGQPPMLVLASGAESLRDDALALVAAVSQAGGQVEKKLYADTSHGWWLDYPSTSESRELIDDVCGFFAKFTN